jgi:hypothetical protein
VMINGKKSLAFPALSMMNIGTNCVISDKKEKGSLTI